MKKSSRKTKQKHPLPRKKQSYKMARLLKEDELYYMMRMLPLVDVVRCSRVCWLWNSIATSPSIWKDLCRYYEPYLPSHLPVEESSGKVPALAPPPRKCHCGATPYNTTPHNTTPNHNHNCYETTKLAQHNTTQHLII